MEPRNEQEICVDNIVGSVMYVQFSGENAVLDEGGKEGGHFSYR